MAEPKRMHQLHHNSFLALTSITDWQRLLTNCSSKGWPAPESGEQQVYLYLIWKISNHRPFINYASGQQRREITCRKFLSFTLPLNEYRKSYIEPPGSLFDFEVNTRGGLLDLVLFNEGFEEKFFTHKHVKYKDSTHHCWNCTYVKEKWK